MIKNYFKIAYRTLLRNKAFSAINILGLSIGIAVCFIITLFVLDELSFDRFNAKADRTYRVQFNALMNGGKISESHVMPPVAPALLKEYPEIEEATRISTEGSPKVIYNDVMYRGGEMAAVDPNFFNVFTLLYIHGNASTALSRPNTVVLTEDYARKYFGNENPLGKVIRIDDRPAPYTVTGVIRNIPKNSHFHFDLFISMAGEADSRSDNWMTSGYFTYIVLKKGAEPKSLEAKFPGMVQKYMGPQIRRVMGMNLEQLRTKGNQLGFVLMPLTDIHFRSKNNYEFEAGGDIQNVYIFSAIAVFMLLIACINFINLSTASASKRAKEVGVRKVLGSGKSALVKQFLFESGLITFIAVLAAMMIIYLALPVFNSLSGKELTPGFTIGRAAGILLIGLVVSAIAGAYPAFFLSSFKPITTLKGKLDTGRSSYGLRSSLVVFQFFISVCLITGTLVIYKQMEYIRNKNLGYDKEQLITIPNSWALGNKEKLFKEELLNDSRVANVTISGYKPAGPSNGNNAFAYPAGKEDQAMRTLEYGVDEDYIPTLGMKLSAGRNFSKELTSDSLSMIINESAAKAFGWGTDAVGQKIFRQNSSHGPNVTYTVIGVVKDFHFKSLHEAISPLLMVLHPESGLIIKARTKDIPGLLHTLKTKWTGYGTSEPFTYAFIDELYYKTYITEQKTGKVLNIFAVLTILVACMGLFGLVTYTTEQRAKEIGIRKVLGASAMQITSLLTKDFLKLVVIACLVAFPLSYWVMYTWLQNFAYRTEISWWILLVAGIAALLVTLLTIGARTVKAAISNPVKSLRAE